MVFVNPSTFSLHFHSDYLSKVCLLCSLSIYASFDVSSTLHIWIFHFVLLRIVLCFLCPFFFNRLDFSLCLQSVHAKRFDTRNIDRLKIEERLGFRVLHPKIVVGVDSKWRLGTRAYRCEVKCYIVRIVQIFLCFLSPSSLEASIHLLFFSSFSGLVLNLKKKNVKMIIVFQV